VSDDPKTYDNSEEPKEDDVQGHRLTTDTTDEPDVEGHMADMTDMVDMTD
jgi:hypothetical protein